MLNISWNMWSQAEQGVTDDTFPSNAFQIFTEDPQASKIWIPSRVLGLLPVGRVWKASKGQRPGGILIRRVNNCSWLLLTQTFPWKTELLALALRPSPATTLRNLISVTCVCSLIPGSAPEAHGHRWVLKQRWTSLFFPMKAKSFVMSGYSPTQRRRQIAVDVHSTPQPCSKEQHKHDSKFCPVFEPFGPCSYVFPAKFIPLTFSDVDLLIHYFEMLHCPKFQSGVFGVFQNSPCVPSLFEMCYRHNMTEHMLTKINEVV